MPPVACVWQRARDKLRALQEELGLKRTQMERLSAEGRSILSALDPMRSKCISYVKEFLVGAPPLAEGCRSSLYAALHSALAPESAAAPLLRSHALTQDLYQITRDLYLHKFALENRGKWIPAQDSTHGIVLTQVPLMAPTVTLHQSRQSNPAVAGLCDELERVAVSCRDMEARATATCAEVRTFPETWPDRQITCKS